MRKSAQIIPADLRDLRKQYEHWRKTRGGSNRTPPELWQQAAILSHRYGITLVSKQLGLNHVTLKAHRQKFEISSIQATAPDTKQDLSHIKARFIELPALLSPQQPLLSNCVQVHCEPNGTLKIFMNSPKANDWSHLMTGFFNASRTQEMR